MSGIQIILIFFVDNFYSDKLELAMKNVNELSSASNPLRKEPISCNNNSKEFLLSLFHPKSEDTFLTLTEKGIQCLGESLNCTVIQYE